MINCWIFNCSRTDNLFTHTGACHGAKEDEKYKKESLIRCGHLSQDDLEINQLPEKIIRISVDDFVGFCCYQINVICRAGDIPKKVKEISTVSQDILNSPAMLRMDYFSKFSSKEFAYELPTHWKFQDIASLEINMSCLYDFFSFLETLKKIADFLEHKFSPDQELFYLWEEFMNRNQGWQSWILCNDLVKDTMANRDRVIELEIEQQALLNLLLSKSIGIFDGDLFDRPDYPSNTKEIYGLIKKHLDIFDSKF